MDQNRKDREKLFQEFPPVSTQAWEEKINKDLKGADYSKKLIWKTGEGFEVKPYYRSEDLQGLEHLDAFPGDFPFVRGNEVSRNDWLIRQDLEVDDLAKANKKALDVLMRGVSSLGFDLKNSRPDEAMIEKLLENIFADAVELNFMAGDYAGEVVEIIESLVKKYNRDLEKIHGSVNYDPLAYISLHGNFRRPEQEAFQYAAELIEGVKHLPHYRVLEVDGSIFKNAGSTIVQEMAFSLAMGNDYLSKLSELGKNINEVAPRIKFRLAVGSNYFMEIAKYRALRILWAHIVNAYGPDHAGLTKMQIHSESSDRNKSVYDPYVNMLRTTTEAMSAIIGGTDSLRVKGYDAVYEKPTEFAERIARNQQLLLKEESYFDKVTDPAAGSYYIENLTQSLMNEAWKLFLNVEEKGGYLKALKEGFIQKEVNAAAEAQNQAVAGRKQSILGTNQYPNFSERMEEGFSLEDIKSHEKTREDAIVETLKPQRSSEAFEKLRFATDRYSEKNKRPVVFLLPIGSLSMRRARAQFSGNFFACAGYEIIDNNGFETVEEGLQAALDKKADIVVLCSSDEEYAQLAPEAKEKLKNQAMLVVAGYPKEILDELKEKGVGQFIHIRSNVLETLKQFQENLGIES